MEALSDLNTFAKILTAKGYSGYFHTQGAYAGKLKDSIGEYLANNRKVTGGAYNQELLVTGYLQWLGEDKPRIECCMRIKCINGKLFLHKMEVVRKDQYGQLLKQLELANLSVITAPKATAAIALVSEIPKQKTVPKSKGYRH